MKPAQTKQHKSRQKILDAAIRLIRINGYAATSVDDLCVEAGLTKGSFFHHFKDKEALGVAAAQHWTAMTAPLFEGAPYHGKETALERVLDYIDFRKSIIRGELADFTCLAGTMAQELHTTHPAIARASGDAITGHAATLVGDIETAMEDSGKKFGFSAQSLALHTQAVLQGGFILTKATGDIRQAEEAISHLRRYVELLFAEEKS